MARPKKKMTKACEKALIELIAYAISLNRDNFHVWVDFSGHVGQFSIRIAKGGFVKGRGGSDLFREYVESRHAKVLTVKRIKELRKILTEASDYKNRPPILSGQKYKIVKDVEVLALMNDFQKATEYAKENNAKVMPGNWKVLDSRKVS